MGIPVTFVTLGCPKNLVDSEDLLTYISLRGFRLEKDYLQTRAILLNTCCFIDEAREESIERILEIVQLKKSNPSCKFLVFGCLPVKYYKELCTELPQVDKFIPGANTEEIYQALVELLNIPTNYTASFADNTHHSPRFWLETPVYAYLKIAEGCNQCCSFCIIPQIRGAYRSKNKQTVIQEAKNLLERGVKELVLVAQHTTAYGKDLHPPTSLLSLLQDLDSLPGRFWIRILYTYPMEISDELLKFIRSSEKIVHYLDVPIQHSHPVILKKMRRPETREYLLELFQKIRNYIPDIALRTTVLVGFPGETDEIFRHMLKFLKEIKFLHVGCFPFSPQKDTSAFKMDGKIPAHVRETRAGIVIKFQQETLEKVNASFLGTIQDVLVEENLDEGYYNYVGRAYFQAPEIDGQVFVHGSNLQPGKFYPVKLQDFEIYDFFGTVQET